MSADQQNRGDGKPVLQVKDLVTSFQVGTNRAVAVNGVTFDVYEGETLGIVGESGSGKSVTSLSILRLVPDPPGHIDGGQILFEGQDLLQLSYAQMRKVRGAKIAMIFQEPMSSLNPVMKIGAQVAETLQVHSKLSKSEARERAVEVLDAVGIPDARVRLDHYPHQFSGGMRQRVMIAMALIAKPKILIADEPTTALDVTIQAQILELMKGLQDDRPETAIILITHDLAVVAETCDRVLVMYGGKVQEIAPIEELFEDPRHPYTQGLLGSIPDPKHKGEPLPTIPGNVPHILELPLGACRFHSRCPIAEERCRTTEPALKSVGHEHSVRCHLVADGVDTFARMREHAAASRTEEVR
jgi:peptide/nickel transport system ATP-binding protein